MDPNLKKIFILILISSLWILYQKRFRIEFVAQSLTKSKYKNTNQKNELTTPKSTIIPSIFYLKTHKTGSSTLQNILYKLGEKYNYSFVIPENRSNQFGHARRRWNVKMVDQWRKLVDSNGKSYNKPKILLNHMRFDPSVLNYFPKENNESLRLTIIRDPATMFSSVFSYFYKVSQAFREAKTIEKFLENPDFYTKKYFSTDQAYCHNYMLYDMGFSECLDKGYLLHGKPSCGIDDFIQFLEYTFDLVLLLEYFDESLILLKHYLNFLTYEDLVYLKKQQRPETAKNDPNLSNNSSSTHQKSRKWNSLEYKIYQHFNQTFFNKMDRIFGGIRSEMMASEKLQLNDALDKFRETCIETDRNYFGFSGNKKVFRYAVKEGLPVEVSQQCEKTVRTPLNWVDIIYKRQQNNKPL